MSYRGKGFTLIELLVAVALVAILLTIAVPNFGSFISQSRVDSVKDKLVSSVAEARSEAIRSGSRVVICRKNSGADTCNGSSTSAGNADWSEGWVIFSDDDGDVVVDVGELVIKVHADIPEQSSIQYTRGDAIIFDGTGLLTTSSSSDEVFSISDSADSSVGAGISIRPTGRIRMCAEWVVSTSTCSDS